MFVLAWAGSDEVLKMVDCDYMVSPKLGLSVWGEAFENFLPSLMTMGMRVHDISWIGRWEDYRVDGEVLA